MRYVLTDVGCYTLRRSEYCFENLNTKIVTSRDDGSNKGRLVFLRQTSPNSPIISQFLLEPVTPAGSTTC